MQQHHKRTKFTLRTNHRNGNKIDTEIETRWGACNAPSWGRLSGGREGRTPPRGHPKPPSPWPTPLLSPRSTWAGAPLETPAGAAREWRDPLPRGGRGHTGEPEPSGGELPREREEARPPRPLGVAWTRAGAVVAGLLAVGAPPSGSGALRTRSWSRRAWETAPLVRAYPDHRRDAGPRSGGWSGAGAPKRWWLL